MKISALEVDGYGVWTGLKLDELSDGLNVFYGPNEAGKTTLMQFVRSVLYGFVGRRQSYLPPVRGGRPGGSLFLNGSNGPCQVSRHQDGRQPDGDDTIDLYNADGVRQSEHQLQSWLYDVDETIFNNVFAVGLHELQELGTLSDTDAAAQLYNLSFGLDRVSVVQVVRDLKNSRKRLLDPTGGSCQVVELLNRRDKLIKEIQALGKASHRYVTLATEHRQADQEVQRLEIESARLQKELRTVETAVAVQDRWCQSADLTARIASFHAAEALPEGILDRLEGINGKLREYESQVLSLKKTRDRLRAEAAALNVNETLCQLAPRIEALTEQEAWIESLQRRVDELETEINRLETELRAEKKRFGLGSGQGNGRIPKISPRQTDYLRAPARHLRLCQHRLEEAEEEIAPAREAARLLGEQIETTLGVDTRDTLPKSLKQAGEVVANLRRRMQLDRRIEQMVRHQMEMERKGRELFHRQLLPEWIVVGVGAVFVFGVMLFLSGFCGVFLRQAISLWLAVSLILMGLSGMLAAALSKFVIERANARQLDACQRQNRMLQTQISQAREEGERIDRELPSGSGSWNHRLEVAEKELAALEALVPVDAQRQTAEQTTELTTRRVTEIKNDLDAAGIRWREALRKVGLSESLLPKQVRDLATRGSRHEERQRLLELRYEELQQRTSELESLTGRVAKLVSESKLSVKVKNEGAVARLHALVACLEDQRERVTKREKLNAQSSQLRRKTARYAKSIDKLENLRQKLFDTAGVENEQQLRQMVADAGHAAELRLQREAIERDIDIALDGHATREEVAAEFDASHDESIDIRLKQIQKQCEDVETGLRGEFEKRGRLDEQLKTLGEDREPAVKQIELSMVENRLEEAIRDWRKLAVSSRILDDIRATYERDRQPETLLEASTHLESLTQGRYSRVWTPFGDDVLLVEDAQGQSLPVDVLSRGTREQLFVCLRLALTASYARRGVPLPMVLDDVLVNFDTGRAKAAAAVLRDFAATGHQLLVFTCHEHVAELFKDLRVHVVRLPSNSETGTTVSIPKKPPKIKRPKKSKPKPKPELEPELKLKPESEIKPEPKPKPEPELKLKPEPELELDMLPEVPVLEPIEPVAVVEPEPIAVVEPIALEAEVEEEYGLADYELVEVKDINDVMEYVPEFDAVESSEEEPFEPKMEEIVYAETDPYEYEYEYEHLLYYEDLGIDYYASRYHDDWDDRYEDEYHRKEAIVNERFDDAEAA